MSRTSVLPLTSQQRKNITKLAFLLPAVIYMVLFFAYPIVKNLIMGFQQYTLSTFYTGSAPWAGITNYTKTISSPVFGQALLNTLLFTAGSLLGQFTLGMAFALFFHRRFPLSGFLRSLLLLPWLLPLIVTSAIWKSLLDQDNGIVNLTLRAIGAPEVSWLTSPNVALISVIIVNIWVGIPFNTTILYGGLQDIPKELYEAASLDGAGKWRSFKFITWPLLRPVVAVLLVLGVVYTLKVLDVILGLTNGGPANSTQTLATQSYTLSFVNYDFGQGAAWGNILILISLIFALIYLRMGKES